MSEGKTTRMQDRECRGPAHKKASVGREGEIRDPRAGSKSSLMGPVTSHLGIWLQRKVGATVGLWTEAWPDLKFDSSGFLRMGRKRQWQDQGEE